MTDKRIRMECPFCHTPANEIQIKSYGNKPNNKIVYLQCKCGCTFTGTSKQEVIDKWNCR